MAMRKSGITQTLLRYPVLLGVLGVILGELFLYCTLRIVVRLYEICTGQLIAHRSVKRRLKNATEFPEWCAAAKELDRLEGRDKWKRDATVDSYFDAHLISDLISQLQDYRQQHNARGLIKVLKLIYSTPNIGGIDNANVYAQSYFGTKTLIHDFVQEVLEATIVVRDSSLPLQSKQKFFSKAFKSYGRSALLLSGGAGLGYFHLGVLKALVESRCLPTVIGGASAGSLMGALICVRTDEELEKDFFTGELARLFTSCEDPIWVKLKRVIQTGYAFDVAAWIEKLQPVTKGHTTFAEAYQRTGRVLNVAITAVGKYVPPMTCNYLTTPHVVIWSAVLASSAFPHVIAPVELLAKDKHGNLKPFYVSGKEWRDGTIKNDVPIDEVAKTHNANFFIVSQVNPHVMPFFFGSRGATGRPSPRSGGSGFRGGFIISMILKFLKLDMIKYLQFLSTMDLLPTIFGTDWRYIFTQTLGGTLTIVPDAGLRHYLRILSDPTVKTMEEYLLKGERATWSNLTRINHHIRFEKLLADSCRYLDRLAESGANAVVRKPHPLSLSQHSASPFFSYLRFLHDIDDTDDDTDREDDDPSSPISLSRSQSRCRSPRSQSRGRSPVRSASTSRTPSLSSFYLREKLGHMSESDSEASEEESKSGREGHSYTFPSDRRASLTDIFLQEEAKFAAAGLLSNAPHDHNSESESSDVHKIPSLPGTPRSDQRTERPEAFERAVSDALSKTTHRQL